jgi:hypothetical protein
MRSVRRKGLVIVLLISIVILLGIVVSVDQWQGGPLGRRYSASEHNDEGIHTVIGKDIWFGGDFLVNPTSLPFKILSVSPMNSPRGLSIKAGTMVNTSGGGVLTLSDGDLKRYKFANEPVLIPPGENIKSNKRYFTALIVVPTQPGTYRINGLFVTYRWGPFTYRAKLASMRFNISAQGNS